MKRIMYVWLAGLILGSMLVPLSSAQDASVPEASVQEPSLGSYARSVRKDKKPPAAKRFDNDNLPKDDKISVVGDASNTAAAMQTVANADSSPAMASNPAKAEVKPGQSAEERQRVYDQWQQRINAKQAEIDLLARELDVDQREYRTRAASFYADAGERLRNQAGWDKEDADYKAKIADKQKALDEAKQQISDLQEEARKSGVPSSAREVQQPEPDQQ